MRAERKPYKRAFAAPAEQKRAPEVVNIKLAYEAKRVILTADQMKHLIRMEHFRNIREGQVDKLYAALMQGESFPSPLILNVVKLAGERRERWRIIDGNHRHTALIRFFKTNPNAKVEVLVTRYDNLTRAEEEEIFRAANGGIQMTFTDWVSKNQDHIPVLRMMRDKFPFPIHVYPVKKGQRGWQFNMLVSAYLNRESSKRRILHLDDKVHLISELGTPDWQAMGQFAKDYLDVFGLPSWGSAWARAVCINALLRVWYWNQQLYDRSETIKAWQEHVVTDGACLEVARAGELSAISELVQRIVAAMNRGRHSSKRFMDSSAYKEWKERKVVS